MVNGRMDIKKQIDNYFLLVLFLLLIGGLVAVCIDIEK